MFVPLYPVYTNQIEKAPYFSSSSYITDKWRNGERKKKKSFFLPKKETEELKHSSQNV